MCECVCVIVVRNIRLCEPGGRWDSVEGPLIDRVVMTGDVRVAGAF